MGGRNNLVVFLVPVLITISLSSSVLGIQRNKLATIHVMNSMPKGSGPMQVHCKSRYTDYRMQQVGEGDGYRCDVRERALYYCMAILGRRVASWHAFQPRRDGSRKAVYWLLKDHGIFLSWDNSSWVRKSMWETE
ncbi:Detected protein of unknown function [Hibiscus syriacus]|uniref:S-protein homolog n=1 Tax=Hibiscus syriacus TaxID=106335 RepID=A0A6A3A1C7_HIBSY|nr:Detected protein of unknown function [Hibiscus syriacus]